MIFIFQSRGDPIKERRIEFDSRKYVIEDLAHALQLARKGIDQVLTCKDDKYNHITEEELKTVEQVVMEKWQWLEEKRAELARAPLTQKAPVSVADIRAEKQVRWVFLFIYLVNRFFLLMEIAHFSGTGQRDCPHLEQAQAQGGNEGGKIKRQERGKWAEQPERRSEQPAAAKGRRQNGRWLRKEEGIHLFR